MPDDPTAPEGLAALASLIEPLAVPAFLAEHWGQAPQHAQGEAGRFASILRTAEFAGLVHEAPFADAGIRLMAGGLDQPEQRRAYERMREGWTRTPDLAAICAAAGEGTTLAFDDIHARHPACRTLCRRLFLETGHIAMATAFASNPGTTTGLLAHFDLMEVFVLQLEGTKTWTLDERREPDPVRAPAHDEKAAFAFRQPRRFTLEPGDMLYVPRGTWHEPSTATTPSLHLSVGLRLRTPLDLLRWLHGELAEDPAMRRSLPLHADRAATDQALRQRLEDARDRIRRALEGEPLAARFLRDDFALGASTFLEGDDG